MHITNHSHWGGYTSRNRPRKVRGFEGTTERYPSNEENKNLCRPRGPADEQAGGNDSAMLFVKEGGLAQEGEELRKKTFIRGQGAWRSLSLMAPRQKYKMGDKASWLEGRDHEESRENGGSKCGGKEKGNTRSEKKKPIPVPLERSEH